MPNSWARKWLKAVAYKATFATDDGQRVLRDLMKFCHADRTSVTLGPHGIDPQATLVAEGRREVWLRIHDFLGLTPDQMRLLAEQARDEDNR